MVSFDLIPRAKQIGESGIKFLYKERCALRNDLQGEVYSNADALYEPIAVHKSIRLFISLAAGRNVFLEGFDIGNACLFGTVDVSIAVNQRKI